MVSDVGRSGDGHLTHRPQLWGCLRLQTIPWSNGFKPTGGKGYWRFWWVWKKDSPPAQTHLPAREYIIFRKDHLCFCKPLVRKRFVLRRSMNQKLSTTSRQLELLEANWDTLMEKANFLVVMQDMFTRKPVDFWLFSSFVVAWIHKNIFSWYMEES